MKKYIHNPLISIFFGSVFGAIIGFSGGGWLGGVGSGVVGSLCIHYFQELVRLKNALDWTEATTLSTVSNVRLLNGLRDLLDQANALPRNYLYIYSDIAAHVSSLGGAIVIGAGEKQYMDYLQLLLANCSKSFNATLRGGQIPHFTPDWFLKTTGILSPQQRLQWLTSVRDADIEVKRRILIFSEDEMRQYLSNDEDRNIILEAMLKSGKGNPGQIYQIDPGKLCDVLGASHGDAECLFVYDDYAFFDEQIVLKHNGATSLIISIKDQTKNYSEVFQLLDTHINIFKNITLTHYGDQTWDNWKCHATVNATR